MNTVIAPPHTSKETYLKVAQNIGAHLAKEAVWYQDRCNWVGSDLAPFEGSFQTVKRSLDNGVYSGLAGIAWFLAQLNARHQDQVIRHTLEGTLNNILATLDPAKRSNFGFYSGNFGIYYTLEKIGQILKRNDLIETGMQGIYTLLDTPILETEIDVVMGAAGAIPVLLYLYKQHKDERLLEIAKKCGDSLLDQATDDTYHSDAYWQTIGAQQGLTGYSHGAAGIALALLELYMFTKEPKYWEYAMKGFNYERRWFDQLHKNWADLRNYTPDKPQTISYGHAWCHGAPGIALSRLRANQLVPDEAYLFRQETEIALESTYEQIQQELANPASKSNYSLCHGIAGNAYSLLLGGVLLNKPHYIQLAQHVGWNGIQRYDKTDTVWASGVNDPSGKTIGQQETPGLMLGLAGTGMFYLALANIEDMHQVLITMP